MFLFLKYIWFFQFAEKTFFFLSNSSKEKKKLWDKKFQHWWNNPALRFLFFSPNILQPEPLTFLMITNSWKIHLFRLILKTKIERLKVHLLTRKWRDLLLQWKAEQVDAKKGIFFWTKKKISGKRNQELIDQSLLIFAFGGKNWFTSRLS